MKKNILKAENIAFSSHPKPLARLTIAITGVTGLLGRNLFFEIIKQQVPNIETIRFVLFGRSNANESFSARIKSLLINDGLFYLNQAGNEKLLSQIMNQITFIEWDLLSPPTNTHKFKLLNLDVTFDYFFHFAAFSDFRMDEHTHNKLVQINLEGTKHALKLAAQLKTKQFIYTGTAYSFDRYDETIYPDSLNARYHFRNFYEKTKYLAEQEVRHFAEQNQMQFNIFRPVGLCGRMLEQPLGSICKFDLFYGWASFFFRFKLKQYANPHDAIHSKIGLKIRIYCNPNGTLNLIPADIAAKLIWEITKSNHSNTSFHLANVLEINNIEYLTHILSALNVSDVQFVLNKPNDLSALEKIYYRAVGDVFEPYLLMPPILFWDENTRLFKKKIGLTGPLPPQEAFSKLIEYATNDYFGLKFEKMGISRKEIHERG